MLINFFCTYSTYMKHDGRALTFRVMFFSSVSSNTACSFLLISSDRSRVSPLSAGCEVYSDAMMPPRRLRLALLMSDASVESAPDSSLST